MASLHETSVPGAVGRVRVVGRSVASGIARLADLALPPTCVGCRRDGTALCPECEARLNGRRGLPPGSPIGLPSHVPLPLVAHEWCVGYAGMGRPAIHALKYGGERRLAEPLGRAMARRWREVAGAGDLLVHVPVHASRLRERGYDQAELLAVAAGRDLGLPVVRALERRRATVRQSELDRTARADNLADAFAVRDAARDAVRGRWVVLVDDVMTTGATLSEAASVLMRAGTVAVSALTLARER